MLCVGQSDKFSYSCTQVRCLLHLVEFNKFLLFLLLFFAHIGYAIWLSFVGLVTSLHTVCTERAFFLADVTIRGWAFYTLCPAL